MYPVRKAALYTLLLCGLMGDVYAQQGENNPFIRGSGASNGSVGQNLFPLFNLYAGGVCEQYGGACSALTDDFVFFDKNPAASSLIYSGPFVGFSYRNYILDSSFTNLAFANSTNNFGFGGLIRYSYAPFTSYDSDGTVLSVFSPADLLFGVNFSYNTVQRGIIDGVSVGTNVKGSVHFLPAGNRSIVSRGSLLFDVGLLVNLHALKIIDFPRPNLSLGATYRNVGVGFVDDKPINILPGELTVGIAYLPIQYLLFSSDVAFSFSNITRTQPAGILDVSVGLGVLPVDFIELGAGFRITSTQYYATVGAAVTILGTQVRFTQRIGPFSDITRLDNFSITISLKTRSTISPARWQSVQKLYLTAFQAFLAQDLDTAIDLVNRALVISPGYLPAQELKRNITSLREVEALSR